MKMLKEEAVKEDIYFLKENLIKLHPDPFKFISKEEFDKQLNQIVSDPKCLEVPTFGINIMKLLSRLRDAHTCINFLKAGDILGKKNFLFKFKFIDNSYFLVQSSAQLKDYLGAELIAINDTDVRTIEKYIQELIPLENETSLTYYLSTMIVEPVILNHYGIINGDKMKLKLNYQGREKIFNLKAEDYNSKTFDILDESKNIDETLIQKETYWIKELKDLNSLYFQYNDCEERKDFKIKDVIDFIRQSNLNRLIIDLRNNKGGDSDVLAPLIYFLREKEDEISLIILTGRDTYSSAIINLMNLQSIKNSITLGEIPHGGPTHFQEAEYFILPQSNIEVSCSTMIYRSKGYGFTDSFKPQYTVSTRIKNLLKGEDTQIEFIKKNIWK